jgi:ABC-type nitrate/sulfonate/bicarbonate transport system substrate-binding protein
MPTKLRPIPFALFAAMLATAPMDYASAQPSCPAMRKINIGVSVAPPNVVHTSPYVAKALGYFEKRCIEANIVQFEGGQSQTSAVAAAQGSAIVSVSDVSIGRGLKVQQIWALAPRMPQAYMVPGEIKSAADLKGKRLSATGGGVGGFNWRMGRAVLKSAKLDVGDAQFIRRRPRAACPA